MVIAHQNFRDEEYFKPRQVFDRNGFNVTVCSSKPGTAVGKLGAKVEPDTTIDSVKAEDYDGLVFIGGGGSSEYFNSAVAHSLAKEMAAAGKPVGAICVAPMTLANAGLLNGRSFTAFPSVVEQIKAKGGIFADVGTVQDGLIITADEPGSAEQFGRDFARMLH